MKIKIPKRLIPYIRNSYCGHMGYSVEESVIQMVQSKLMDELANQTVKKLKKTKRLLKDKS